VAQGVCGALNTAAGKHHLGHPPDTVVAQRPPLPSED
jgi:hypothetical protein